MTQFYDHKIGWCYVCNAGWVEIVKEKGGNRFIVYCEECERMWNSPEAFLQHEKALDFGVVRWIEDVTMEEIEKKG